MSILDCTMCHAVDDSFLFLEWWRYCGHDAFHQYGSSTFRHSCFNSSYWLLPWIYEDGKWYRPSHPVRTKTILIFDVVANYKIIYRYLYSNFRWIEIFGKLVAVLALRGEFQYDDERIDGQEFKNHVIVSICRLPWGQNNGASLIAALRYFITKFNFSLAIALHNTTNWVNS